MQNMKALLQRHKKKKEEKDKKKKGALSSPSSPDESEEVTRMASLSIIEVPGTLPNLSFLFTSQQSNQSTVQITLLMLSFFSTYVRL